MTITELRTEARSLAREHWWNGAGVVVVAFLIVAFIWKKPDNEFLLYAALIAVGAHSYVSACCYERKRRAERHRAEIAVAFKQELQRENSRVPDRPVAGRPGRPAVEVERRRPHLVGAAAH